MEIHRPRLITALIAIATVLAAGGCASSTRTADRADQPPPSFSLDLTILVGTGVSGDEALRPHPLRQSRYVLFPDGRLHYGADPDRGAGWLPPPVRTLSSQMMQELWLLAGEKSLADPLAGEEPINFKTLQAAPGEVLYLLAVTCETERWAVIRTGPASAPDPAMAQFVGHLAELAWAEHPTEALRSLQPRYDFGPDPYERYR